MIEKLLVAVFGERLLRWLMIVLGWFAIVLILASGVRVALAEPITINSIEAKNPYLTNFRATQLKDIARSFLSLHGVKTREGFTLRPRDPFAKDRTSPDMLIPSDEAISWYLTEKKRIKPNSILSVVTPPSTFDGRRYINAFSLKNAFVGGFSNLQCNEFNVDGKNRMIYCLIALLHEWLHLLGCSHDNTEPLSIMNEDALGQYINNGVLPPIGEKCLRQLRRAKKRFES